jgi:hydrogenase small subunit
MSEQEDTILEHLQRRGVSRRSFLKFCTLAASSMALPLSSIAAFADALGAASRPKVIWLSAQECTGCSETLLRAWDHAIDKVTGLPNYNSTTVQDLLLDMISLDYHNTLMAPSGSAAEQSRLDSIKGGGQVVILDGSIPLIENGAWSAVGGRTILDVLKESVVGAGLIIAVGNCATFGGLPGAKPNPTDAHGMVHDDGTNDLITILGNSLAPVINIPGCPPVPEVLTGVIVNFIASKGAVPVLDNLKRPTQFYGKTVHEDCSRLAHFNAGEFADSFDDAKARQGWCLEKLGCKGPVTRNACTSTKWNMGTSYPMLSGHGCLGCSEPGFWDHAPGNPTPGGFYKPLF